MRGLGDEEIPKNYTSLNMNSVARAARYASLVAMNNQ